MPAAPPPHSCGTQQELVWSHKRREVAPAVAVFRAMPRRGTAIMARRALILHDDPDCRRIYAAALSYASFEVVATDDPDRAISALRAIPPSVIVTDLYLESIADESVLVRLRREPNATGVPAIVISSWTTEPRREAAAKLGAVAFLRLPVSPGDLIELVLELVGPVPPADALRSRLATPRRAQSPRK
jgi:DNA-binding NtrC family response regulator